MILTEWPLIKAFMKKNEHPDAKIQVTKEGPYLVSGNLPLSEQWIVTNAARESLEYREGKKYPAQPQYALNPGDLVRWRYCACRYRASTKCVLMASFTTPLPRRLSQASYAAMMNSPSVTFFLF
jgi:hypothetical protein